MKQIPNNRLSSQPFTINLSGNDYSIEMGELEAQLDAKLLRKTTWFSPHLQFKSFRGKQLTLFNSFQDQKYLLRIEVEPDKLAISCSCNQPVETLCLHSYRALRDVAIFKSNTYFKQFAPGGWVATALANKKAFAFNDHKQGPEIKSLPPHEKIYGLNSILEVTNGLLQQPIIAPEKDRLVCYLILSFSRRRVPPILMPCLALPTKNGNRPKSFCSFMETIGANKAHYFNESQQMLNSLCLAMLKEAEKIQEQDESFRPAWQWEHYHKLFQIWQECWPLLCTQPQVYYSHIYQLKYIKGKPRLRETIPVTVSPEKVYPQFIVKKYPDHQRLSMNIPHQNKQLRSEAGILPFFVDCPETDCFYLLPSLAMTQLVSQMHDAEPFISVFKQQYKSFQKEVITPLTKQGLLLSSAAMKKKSKTQNPKPKTQTTKPKTQTTKPKIQNPNNKTKKKKPKDKTIDKK